MILSFLFLTLKIIYDTVSVDFKNWEVIYGKAYEIGLVCLLVCSWRDN